WRPEKPEYLKGEESFFMPDTTLNKKRAYTVLGVTLGGYALAYGGLYYTWYRDFPLTDFHWFDDWHEWQQVDKMGHAYGGYQGGRGLIGLLKWSGMNRKKAAIWGGLLGGLTLHPLELLDGFAEKWGASWGDMLTNQMGGALATMNELLWSEQRIQMKISYHPTGYAKFRPEVLGDNTTRYLKDYNGHTTWLSFRVHSWLNQETKFGQKYPRWLNVAFGYGANHLMGGYGTELTDAIREREYRQYYLALDVDLSNIRTKSGALNLILDILNFIHLPSPTFEFNGKHGFRWHWLYM
ncbi:MAG: DUF2279 domain-containing protein, partial [Bacteroidota bacterium]